MTDALQVHKSIVQNSFGMIVNQSTEIVSKFYDHLFETLPEVQPLFKGDMSQMRHKFFQMLASIVAALHDEEQLKMLMQSIGKTHKVYGVKAEYYVLMRDNLIWVFGDVLQDRFTPEMQTAWGTVYNHLAELATDGVYEK